MLAVVGRNWCDFSPDGDKKVTGLWFVFTVPFLFVTPANVQFWSRAKTEYFRL
jgi:hypothetical protein